jgi:hypothetical protein
LQDRLARFTVWKPYARWNANSREDTSDQQGDDLERSTGTIQERSVKSAETQTLDDRTREVGEDTVGYRGTEHGKRQHPSLDVVERGETLPDVESGGLDTGTVLGDTSDGERPILGFEPNSIGRTTRWEIEWVQAEGVVYWKSVRLTHQPR